MADSKITDLASASTPLTGTEVVYLVQGGLDTQATAQDIADLGGGGGTWGSITGTLSDQTDLQAALDAKAPTANPTFTGVVQATTLQADTSAGLLVESDAGTDVVLFGAGGGSNATFYGGVNINGAVAITSNSSQALAVGPNGATNPAFRIDASTASSVNGIEVKSSASGSGVSLSTISSATNESLTISAKGFSGLNLNNGGGFVNLQSSTVQLNANAELVNRDLAQQIKDVANTSKPEDTIAIIDTIEKSRDRIDRNVRDIYVMDALAATLKRKA